MLGRGIQMVNNQCHAGYLNSRWIIRPPQSDIRFGGKPFDGLPVSL
jgi:hypothetical protein